MTAIEHEHEHEWSDWAHPIVLRDSLNVAIGAAGPNIGLALHPGTNAPTAGWWRTCRFCPAEQRS